MPKTLADQLSNMSTEAAKQWSAIQSGGEHL